MRRTLVVVVLAALGVLAIFSLTQWLFPQWGIRLWGEVQAPSVVEGVPDQEVCQEADQPIVVVVVIEAQPKPEPTPQPAPPVVVEEPVLRTDNVLMVTSTSADLSGFVDPKGETVNIWLEYGERSSLDRRTNEISVNSTTSFVRRILGLSPGTKYSFRMAGRIGGRAFYGSTRTFITDR